jgi:hypothetical protein
MSDRTGTTPAAAGPAPTGSSASTGQVVRSLLLWVLVVAGLAYGVVETAGQAAALFGS